jgi:hypothetical protein
VVVLLVVAAGVCVCGRYLGGLLLELEDEALVDALLERPGPAGAPDEGVAQELDAVRPVLGIWRDARPNKNVGTKECTNQEKKRKTRGIATKCTRSRSCQTRGGHPREGGAGAPLVRQRAMKSLKSLDHLRGSVRVGGGRWGTSRMARMGFIS